MSDFVKDALTLFTDKVATATIPDGHGVTEYARAVDLNSLRDAAYSLRTAISGWVNVKSYGARGDGVTDDTAAIQAAYASAKAAKRKLFLPDGRYRITAPIVIDAADVIEGAGPGSPEFTGYTSRGATIVSEVTTDYAVKVNVSPFQRGFAMRNLRIYGQGTAKHGLYLNGVGWDSVLENVTVDGFTGHGVFVDYAQDVRFVNLSVYFSGKDASTYGLYVNTSSNYLTFPGLHIEGCPGSIYFNAVQYVTVDAFHVEIGDYPGTSPYDTTYSAAPVQVVNSSDVTFANGRFIPASVGSLMSAYSITADAVAYMVDTTNVDRLKFIGVTWPSPMNGIKPLRIASSDPSKRATIDASHFGAVDIRTAGIDVQYTTIANTDITGFDDGVATTAKLLRMSHGTLSNMDVNLYNPTGQTKAAGYLLEAYSSAFDTRLENVRVSRADKTYRLANKAWGIASTPPPYYFGSLPAGTITVDLESYPDEYVYAPGASNVITFANPKGGQTVTVANVLGSSGAVVKNSTSVLLKGGVDATVPANGQIVLRSYDADGKLWEVGRNF